MIWALPTAIACLTGAAFLVKDRGALLVGGVLLGNWCVNTFIVWVSGVSLPWPLFMAVDYVSAVALLNPNIRLTKWQVGVALLYGIEMIGHCAFGLSDLGPWAQYRYYYLLLYVAWAQCGLLGGYVGWGALRGVVRYRRGDRGLQHIHAGSVRLGEKRDGAGE